MQKGGEFALSALSDMLIYLRKRNRVSQGELAEVLGVSRSSVSMYELGEREPGIETLEAIADYFNVDMNTLTGRAQVDLSMSERGRRVGLLYDLASERDRRIVDMTLEPYEERLGSEPPSGRTASMP